MYTTMEERDYPASPPSRISQQLATAQKSLRTRVADFADDAAGGVMIMFALMASAMFMMIGLAVDYGRYVNARDQTASAIDAAVLAAGRALQTGQSATAAVEIAKKYYKAAVQNRVKLHANSDTISFVVVDNGTAVQAKGNAKIDTPFMGIGGTKQLTLLRDSESTQAKAVLAVGGNSETNIEIAMMLDISGSMCNNSVQPCSTGRKLDAMKTAAKDLINITVWADQSKYYSKVALVPFSADVRAPTSLLSALAVASGNKTHKNGSKTYYFAPTPCAAEREGTNKYTDVAPSGTTNVVSRLYTEVSSATATGSCSIATSAVMVPLTANKTTLNTAIDALIAQGGTAGHVGTAWSYYMLSPKWSSFLTGLAKPAVFGDAKYKKIAVLMTDGEYNFTSEKLKDKSSSGTVYNPVVAVASSEDHGVTGTTAASINGQTSAYQAIQICTQMKASGIEVYTVGFELPNQTAINTLASCATDATHAYKAEDGEQLKQAFRDIALKISSLYLSK